MKRKLLTEALGESIRNAGLRATRQRTELLRILTEAPGPHSVEELTLCARGAFDMVTAYRMVDAFVTVGIARRIELAQGRALYEIVGEHHHHIVCTSCGRIEDIHICLPETAYREILKQSTFASIDTHALEYFGVCDRCAV